MQDAEFVPLHRPLPDLCGGCTSLGCCQYSIGSPSFQQRQSTSPFNLPIAGTEDRYVPNY